MCREARTQMLDSQHKNTGRETQDPDSLSLEVNFMASLFCLAALGRLHLLRTNLPNCNGGPVQAEALLEIYRITNMHLYAM